MTVPDNSHYLTYTQNEGNFFTISEILVEKKSKFQEIVIARSPLFGKCLFLDGILQISELGEPVYHESMIHPAVVTTKQPPKRALILGGGDGCALRELLKYKTIEEVVMVDLDNDVVELSKQYLKEIVGDSFEDPRANIIIGDAVEYVSKSQNTDNKFDVIVMDLVDATGEAKHLASKEFFTSCSNLLSEGGVLVTHGAFNEDMPYSCRLYKTLQNLFKYAGIHVQFIPSFAVQWAFIVCSNAVDPLSVSAQDAEKRTSGIEFRHYIPQAHASLFMLSKLTKNKISNYSDKEIPETGKFVKNLKL